MAEKASPPDEDRSKWTEEDWRLYNEYLSMPEPDYIPDDDEEMDEEMDEADFIATHGFN